MHERDSNAQAHPVSTSENRSGLSRRALLQTALGHGVDLLSGTRSASLFLDAVPGVPANRDGGQGEPCQGELAHAGGAI